MTLTATSFGRGSVRSALMMKVFLAFACLALLSGLISLAGRWFGATIAMGGHTDDRTPHEIVIGNDVVVAPANMIRQEAARKDGVARRLDLYARWPELSGFTRETAADFNGVASTRSLVFLSFEPRVMSRDMSGRFDPIYRALIAEPGRPAEAGLTAYGFKTDSGYLDEELVVGQRPGAQPFVARCQTGPTADEALAPCERDVTMGEELSLTYRFPRDALADWNRLDADIVRLASGMVKTGR